MDFGVFNLLQHRDRSKSPHEVLEEALSHTRLAEELGFSRVWFAEHHFSNYSLSPSSLILCTQAAAVTKRIRVGSAVLILPLHAPARLIAEIALVDTLSGGRLDIGVGSGYQNYEFERLGADISQRKVIFNELLDMIELGLRQPNFSYKGTFLDQPRTAINVRPLQSPRPPIWIADPTEFHRRCAQDGYIPIISCGIKSPINIKKMRDQSSSVIRRKARIPPTSRWGCCALCASATTSPSSIVMSTARDSKIALPLPWRTAAKRWSTTIWLTRSRLPANHRWMK